MALATVHLKRNFYHLIKFFVLHKLQSRQGLSIGACQFYALASRQEWQAQDLM